MDHGNNDDRRKKIAQVGSYAALTGYGVARNQLIKSVMKGAKMPPLARFGFPALVMMGALWGAKQATGGSKVIKDEINKRHNY